MGLLNAPGCDYSHVHVVKALFDSGSKVMFFFSSQVKNFFISSIGRPASDTKACGQKYLSHYSTLIIAYHIPYILPLLHPNRLWYLCQCCLLHHCNILTFTKWLLSRPFSTGLTNSSWWSNQWVAFITLVNNHHIISSAIIADSTTTKLFWSVTINSYRIETCAFWKHPHKVLHLWSCLVVMWWRSVPLE